MSPPPQAHCVPVRSSGLDFILGHLSLARSRFKIASTVTGIAWLSSGWNRGPGGGRAVTSSSRSCFSRGATRSRGCGDLFLHMPLLLGPPGQSNPPRCLDSIPVSSPSESSLFWCFRRAGPSDARWRRVPRASFFRAPSCTAAAEHFRRWDSQGGAGLRRLSHRRSSRNLFVEQVFPRAWSGRGGGGMPSTFFFFLLSSGLSCSQGRAAGSCFPPSPQWRPAWHRHDRRRPHSGPRRSNTLFKGPKSSLSPGVKNSAIPSRR